MNEALPAPVPRRKRGRVVRRVLLLILAWVGVHVAMLLWMGFHDDTRPTDVGVVLGNFVEADGTVGDVVRARLDRAVELYKAGVFAHVIVSGAVYPPKAYDEPTGMKRYLIEQGVPADAVIPDFGGANTYYTALNTRRIMREHDWRSVTVVSHYYHILRCRFAFARAGVSNVRSAHAWLDGKTTDPAKIFREFVAFYRYVFRFYPADAPVPPAARATALVPLMARR